MLGKMLTPLGVPLMLIGSALFIRTILIISGRLKSPLLRSFEAYTESPTDYNSLRALALWLTVFLVGALFTLSDFMRVPWPALLPALLALVVTLIAHEQGRAIRRSLPFLMPLPYWYAEVMSRTTPIERRRIAYLWLRLPVPLRKHYSAHDPAFLRWVDLIIVGTFG